MLAKMYLTKLDLARDFYVLFRKYVSNFETCTSFSNIKLIAVIYKLSNKVIVNKYYFPNIYFVLFIQIMFDSNIFLSSLTFASCILTHSVRV